jgi:hypothetical protein
MPRSQVSPTCANSLRTASSRTCPHRSSMSLVSAPQQCHCGKGTGQGHSHLKLGHRGLLHGFHSAWRAAGALVRGCTFEGGLAAEASVGQCRCIACQRAVVAIVTDARFFYGLFVNRLVWCAGKEGPKTREPSKYIRYIYNRVILENATVRAAAVSSLANFGATVRQACNLQCWPERMHSCRQGQLLRPTAEQDTLTSRSQPYCQTTAPTEQLQSCWPSTTGEQCTVPDIELCLTMLCRCQHFGNVWSLSSNVPFWTTMTRWAEGAHIPAV